MTFEEALKRLNIEDFKERILHSNSHGELFHLRDYISMAERLKDDDEMAAAFRPVFLICVKYAEKEWSRPESVFQHMPRMMSDAVAHIGKLILPEMSERKVPPPTNN